MNALDVLRLFHLGNYDGPLPAHPGCSICEALTRLEAVVEAARRADSLMGKHLEDCCRTDLGLNEQLRSHDDAVRASLKLIQALRALDAGPRREP